jgi:hypothetical protein
MLGWCLHAQDSVAREPGTAAHSRATGLTIWWRLAYRSGRNESSKVTLPAARLF